MLRWLFIALIIYMIYRLITGSKRHQRRSPYFTFRFGKFPGADGSNSQNRHNQRQKTRLEQIEDAEFEDITEKDTQDTTEKKTDT